MKRAINTALALCALSLSSGNALAENYDLDALQTLSPSDIADREGSGSDPLRLKSMRNTALSVGAQHGFYSRLQGLKQELEDRDEYLSAIYDFGTIMKIAADGDNEMFFLPPVIRQAESVMAVSDDNNTVRVSGTLYEIKRPARLTLRAPHWRQYLTMTEEIPPNAPNKALLPRTSAERAQWKRWVAEGWRAGLRQAEDEMRVRVGHLGEDFIGMIRYLRLVEEGKIHKPNIGVLKQQVVNSGAVMRENEAVYQLSFPAQFNGDADDWNPLYGDGRGSFLFPIEPTGR